MGIMVLDRGLQLVRNHYSYDLLLHGEYYDNFARSLSDSYSITRVGLWKGRQLVSAFYISAAKYVENAASMIWLIRNTDENATITMWSPYLVQYPRWRTRYLFTYGKTPPYIKGTNNGMFNIKEAGHKRTIVFIKKY